MNALNKKTEINKANKTMCVCIYINYTLIKFPTDIFIYLKNIFIVMYNNIICDLLCAILKILKIVPVAQ